MTEQNIKRIISKAENGDVAAQKLLGCLYEWGAYFEQNDDKAFYWYKKAAEQGDEVSQRDVGDYYYYGGYCIYGGIKDVKKRDIDKAIYWYSKSAELGDDRAQSMLQECYKYCLENGYEEGAKTALNAMSSVLQYNKVEEFGLPEDYDLTSNIVKQNENGIECLDVKNVEPIDAYSQYMLGNSYEHGVGAGMNYPKAVYWYEKSAVQGNKHAQFALGKCYYNGVGVNIDYKKAIYWLKKASKSGSTEAKELIKWIKNSR